MLFCLLVDDLMMDVSAIETMDSKTSVDIGRYRSSTVNGQRWRMSKKKSWATINDWTIGSTPSCDHVTLVTRENGALWFTGAFTQKSPIVRWSRKNNRKTTHTASSYWRNSNWFSVGQASVSLSPCFRHKPSVKGFHYIYFLSSSKKGKLFRECWAIYSSAKWIVCILIKMMRWNGTSR